MMCCTLALITRAVPASAWNAGVMVKVSVRKVDDRSKLSVRLCLRIKLSVRLSLRGLG